MAQAATLEAYTSWPASIKDKVDFRVHDCAQPLPLPEDSFILVFAAWLLNYAATSFGQLSMWQNIHANLRPGGHFIGIPPNVHMNLGDHPVDDRFGHAILPLRKVEDGYECLLAAYTQPKHMAFDMYHLSERGIQALRC